MMILQMDEVSGPISRGQPQRLRKNNIEPEKRQQRPARLLSDPNAWLQTREKYEAMLLEDHTLSEQHSIEYALWQLHYKKIEEFRLQLGAALASKSTNGSQSGKGQPRFDRSNKIRLQFKTFLSETTGFYHDLMLKIKAKHGFPMGYFSDDSERQIATESDGKKSIEAKKGLVSCHRCLIYLGDLARYKGLYGEGDSKSCDFEAALSYYSQAASVWPFSGNPHHQLAILATYSEDDFLAVYRYFRSIAVDSPSATARDNLIVAFEKNRQSYKQLYENMKASAVNESRVRRKKEAKFKLKDSTVDAKPSMVGASRTTETYKTMCVRFVRLNGLLFTRTSLETFGEILTSVSGALSELLSLGTEEVLNFGKDIAENALVVVRLISMLIFSVHNANKGVESQTYADIVQRAVVLQNALLAVFELMGCVLRRCLQLRDPSSSYLLPGILVLLEWLACSTYVVEGGSLQDEQSIVRSKFWNDCVSFLNKLLSSGLVSIDDGDESCSSTMSGFEIVETESCLVLAEDFELRGFLPLQPAHTILDFSRRRSFGVDGRKEKIARVKRIVTAGKVLATGTSIDKNPLHFDAKANKFFLELEPKKTGDVSVHCTGSPKSNGANPETLDSVDLTRKLVVMHPKTQFNMEGEEDDEIIVFNPTANEKRMNVYDSECKPDESLNLVKNAFEDGSLSLPESVNGAFIPPISVTNPVIENSHSNGLQSSVWPINQYSESIFPPQIECQRTAVDLGSQPLSVVNVGPQHLHKYQSHSSLCSSEKEALTNGYNNLNPGHAKNPKLQMEGVLHPALSLPAHQPLNVSRNGFLHSHLKAMGGLKQPKIDTVASDKAPLIQTKVGTVSAAGELLVASVEKTFSDLSLYSRNPMDKPFRHLGPPPGFGHPSFLQDARSDVMGVTPLTDDYRWLDGYQLPLSMKFSRQDRFDNHLTNQNSLYTVNGNRSMGIDTFPFPGKGVSAAQSDLGLQKGWEDWHNLEGLKLPYEQLQQMRIMDNHQDVLPLSAQYHGQPNQETHQFV